MSLAHDDGQDAGIWEPYPWEFGVDYDAPVNRPRRLMYLVLAGLLFLYHADHAFAGEHQKYVAGTVRSLSQRIQLSWEYDLASGWGSVLIENLSLEVGDGKIYLTDITPPSTYAVLNSPLLELTPASCTSVTPYLFGPLPPQTAARVIFYFDITGQQLKELPIEYGAVVYDDPKTCSLEEMEPYGTLEGFVTVAPIPEPKPADLDGDGDVDLHDYALFIEQFEGAE